MMANAEALIFGHKAGLDLQQVVNLLSGGAAGSKSLTLYGERQLRRDFEPGFSTDLFVKDLKIALDSAAEMGISLPSTALAAQFYKALQA